MSAKRVLILKGSPREKGNSSTLADRAAAGARESGAQVESFDLFKLKIAGCDACDFCQNSGESKCSIEDDMQTLYPKLRQADTIILASPVYWFTVSAQLKLCIDRWYSLMSPQGCELKEKQFGLILAYGGDDPFDSGAVNAIRTFQDMCHLIGGKVIGIVYGSATAVGDILTQPEILEKAHKLGQKSGRA